VVGAEIVRNGLDDLQALALTLFFEAGGEPVEGAIAVGCVIRNRVAHPKRFGTTYRAVVHAKSQFSCWWPWGGLKNFEHIIAASEALRHNLVLPFNEIELAEFQECCYVAEGIIGGQIKDRVRGATHYYAPEAMVPKGRVPDWAKGLSPAAKVGGHLFFVAA
jgi:N-acetylmuramoyl-L-alanine amidase